ncbi:DUF2505 domain-containing protein [Spongiibacter taiwanensis]|uniref:DUF2505 domain-containing protein n=1 Tax=Spongiibacter taiwanensis TaxID=1748242 RepID=UPI00203579BE|nr:DUF2505 domain-containing protein [Spongiibacter taiwanensis]USA42840.1 DUF2505 domain-containing protein [Spongiibacter taiwanensis]
MAVTFVFDRDLPEVAALFLSPDFRRFRSERLGESQVSCKVKKTASQGHEFLMSRRVTRSLPAMFSKFFEPSQLFHLRENWQNTVKGWNGEFEVAIEGQSIDIYGDFALEPHRAGCRYTINHQCAARVPLIGRRLEKFVISQADKGVEQELTFLQAYLRGDIDGAV